MDDVLAHYVPRYLGLNFGLLTLWAAPTSGIFVGPIGFISSLDFVYCGPLYVPIPLGLVGCALSSPLLCPVLVGLWFHIDVMHLLWPFNLGLSSCSHLGVWLG